MQKKTKPTSGNRLTTQQEDELIKSLNKFGNWLIKKKIVKSLEHINHTVDLPWANEDWVMKVDEKNSTVSFNTIVIKKCSYKYFEAIVLHEFFHLAVQKVPNKEDAVRVKDDFGDVLMKLIDIEADFYTALYYKEKLNLGLVDYLQLYYEGSKVFSDRKIRTVKLERFIGTLLSISKMFIDNPRKKDIPKAYDLYLPTISPIYTEESLHVLVIKKEHIYFDEIHATYQDFADLKACYTNLDTYSVKDYVKRLVSFACKAFKIPIPQDMQLAIDNIPN